MTDSDHRPTNIATSLDEARFILERVGFPVVVRSRFSDGAKGNVVVKDSTEFDAAVLTGLGAAAVADVSIEPIETIA